MYYWVWFWNSHIIKLLKYWLYSYNIDYVLYWVQLVMNAITVETNAPSYANLYSRFNADSTTTSLYDYAHSYLLWVLPSLNAVTTFPPFTTLSWAGYWMTQTLWNAENWKSLYHLHGILIRRSTKPINITFNPNTKSPRKLKSISITQKERVSRLKIIFLASSRLRIWTQII